MIIEFEGKTPQLAPTVWVAEGAKVIGDVVMGEESTVWFNTVIRGDIYPIRIGRRTNIQDLCMIHVTGGRAATTLGDEITVGHHVVLHGCTIGDRCLIGMGSVILDGAEIGSNCLVAAQSLVPPGFKCGPNKVIMGTPAKVVREVGEKELAMIEEGQNHYVEYARRFRESSRIVSRQEGC